MKQYIHKQALSLNTLYHGYYDNSASTYKREDGQAFNTQSKAANVNIEGWQQKLIKGSNAPYSTRTAQATDSVNDVSVIDHAYLTTKKLEENNYVYNISLGIHHWIYFDAADTPWILKAVFTPNATTETVLVQIYNTGTFGRMGKTYPTINKLIGSYTYTPQFDNTPTASTFSTGFVDGLAEGFVIEPNPDGSKVHLHMNCEDSTVIPAMSVDYVSQYYYSIETTYLIGIIPITISGTGLLTTDTTHGNGLSLSVGTVRHGVDLYTGQFDFDQSSDDFDNSWTDDQRVQHYPPPPTDCVPIPPYTGYTLDGDVISYKDTGTGYQDFHTTAFTKVMRSVWSVTDNDFVDLEFSFTRDDALQNWQRYNVTEFITTWYGDQYCPDYTPVTSTVYYPASGWIEHSITQQEKIDRTYKIKVGTVEKTVDYDYNKYKYSTESSHNAGFVTITDTFSGAIDGHAFTDLTDAKEHLVFPFISHGGVIGLGVGHLYYSTVYLREGYYYAISPTGDAVRNPSTGWGTTGEYQDYNTSTKWYDVQKFDPATGDLLDVKDQKF